MLRADALGFWVQAVQFYGRGLRVLVPSGLALGLGVEALGFRVEVLGFRVQAVRLGVLGLQDWNTLLLKCTEQGRL